MRFAKWIRTRYEFPVRLNIYFSPLETVIAPISRERGCVSIAWFPDPGWQLKQKDIGKDDN